MEIFFLERCWRLVTSICHEFKIAYFNTISLSRTPIQWERWNPTPSTSPPQSLSLCIFWIVIERKKWIKKGRFPVTVYFRGKQAMASSNFGYPSVSCPRWSSAILRQHLRSGIFYSSSMSSAYKSREIV